MALLNFPWQVGGLLGGSYPEISGYGYGPSYLQREMEAQLAQEARDAAAARLRRGRGAPQEGGADLSLYADVGAAPPSLTQRISPVPPMGGPVMAGGAQMPATGIPDGPPPQAQPAVAADPGRWLPQSLDGYLQAPFIPSAPTDISSVRAPVPQQAALSQQQPQPQSAAPGLGDRFSAGLHGYLNSTSPMSALSALLGGLSTGQRQDPAGRSAANRAAMTNALYQALRQQMPDAQAIGIAQAAASDPKMAETLLPQALRLVPPSTVEGVVADQMYRANRGSASGSTASGAGVGAPSAAAPDPMQTYTDMIERKAAAEKRGTVTGESAAKAAIDLPGAVAKLTEQARLIEQLRVHPGRDSGVFWHSKMSPYVRDDLIPGNTDARDAVGLLNQIKGGAFLAAYEQLKGGGQITEIEGKKATEAIARMERSQSRAEFDRAIDEYLGILRTGIDRANQTAGQSPPYGFKGNAGMTTGVPAPPTGFRILR